MVKSELSHHGASGDHQQSMIRASQGFHVRPSVILMATRTYMVGVELTENVRIEPLIDDGWTVLQTVETYRSTFWST